MEKKSTIEEAQRYVDNAISHQQSAFSLGLTGLIADS
jgi:hypothetical protein